MYFFNQLVVHGAPKGSYAEGPEGTRSYDQSYERGNDGPQFEESSDYRHAKEYAEGRNDERH